MKKTITMILTSILLLLVSSCGNTTEINNSPTPRPLNLRRELLTQLQDENNALRAQMPEITIDTMDKAENIMDKLTENLQAQDDIIKGVNGEESLDDAIKRTEQLLDEYDNAIDSGKRREAKKIQKELNIIFYGNKDGIKNW